MKLKYGFSCTIVTGLILITGCATSMKQTTDLHRPPAISKKPAIKENAKYRKDRYPVDGRGFSPVDVNIAKLGTIADDSEGSLNPYVLAIATCYPFDGSYPYRCKPLEYDLYNGVTQDLWYKGRVVAKAYPDNSRCSYCCGWNFEVFVRAMQYRNIQKGLDPDDFNGMTFYDLFNLLQFWYIEATGDSPQKGVVAYGLGKAIDNYEDAKPGDFLDFNRNNKTGHSVIFDGWLRDSTNKIIGFEYYGSNYPGVGHYKEFFVEGGGKVIHKDFHLVRVGSIADYKSYDRTKIAFHRAYAP